MRILRLIMECLTPLHCGSGSPHPVQDRPVARDAFGFWRIPGTSLAGSLRALAMSLNENIALRLFGSAKANAPSPSMVWCRDGLLLDYDGEPALAKKLAGKAVHLPLGPFVRDHVRLDPVLGSAVEGGKFDAEIVPAGTRFLLEFRLDGWTLPPEDQDLLFFDQLCAAVHAGELPLGGKLGNGYGRYKTISFQYLDLNLGSAQGMEAWLNISPFGKITGGEPVSLPLEAPVRQRDCLDGSLTLPLRAIGPILVAGGVPDDNGGDAADMVFALTPRLDYDKSELLWTYAIPGSSLKGALRHRIYEILVALTIDRQKTQDIIDNLFGMTSGDSSQCGKVGVEDCQLAGENSVFTQHVAIDRFTGGTVTGALFSEQPLWSEENEVLIKLHVNKASAHEAALIFHALFDLAEGALALGNGVNRGNGRFRLPHWPEEPQKALVALSGSLKWNNEPLLPVNISQLQNLATHWDKALQEKI